MANQIKMLLWLRKHKINKQGKVPLMLRLSFQNNRQDKATGFYVDPTLWNPEKQRLKGSKGLNSELNAWMDSMAVKINLIAKKEEEKGNLHLPSVMEKLFAKATEEPSLLNVMSTFVNDMKDRVGKDFAHSTYEKYVFTQKKITAFVHSNLKKRDILLRDLTTKFIIDFDHYLRVEENNQNNTAVKYCLNLKRVINVAVMQGLLPLSPFNKYKTIYRDTPQVYLSEFEVSMLENVALVKNQHKIVRDLFIFQCYTGLAYTDMIALTIHDISVDKNLDKWIVKRRQKSGIVSTIPLLTKALIIIDKYKNLTDQTDQLLPHYSIQKYNEYITEIGVMAKIPQKLSSHVGRRTFGNVALSKGISINVISKILGHSNTIITQRIYAITTQNIISKEMVKWD